MTNFLFVPEFEHYGDIIDQITICMVWQWLRNVPN